MDTSHESAHERVAHTTIALAPLMPASPIARWRLCRCEQVNLVRGKKSRVSFPQFATRKHFGIFRFSPIFPSLLPPMNFPRSSRREIEGSMETNKYLYRCDRYRSLHVWAFFQKRKKEICVDSPWLERGIVEATTPATHDAGGVGVSQIQIRSRCSRDTHPPCLRSDTRADLHVRGRVASPRIAAVVVSSLIPSRFLSLRFP